MLLGSGNDHDRKRKSETEGSAPVEEVTRKRPTRFADQGSAAVGVAAIAAAAKAAEIARNIHVKLPSSSGEYGNQQQAATSQEAANRLARAAEMQAELSAQIASVASLFSNAQQTGTVPVDRKPTYRPLLLDALGREIDEYGQVVKTTVAKSLAANVAVERELKKKENPYLIHQRVPARAAPLGPPGVVAASLPSSVPGSVVLSEDQGFHEQIDDRIVTSNRNLRAKKSLKFVEAGVYIQKADEIRYKEERKIIAGYSSGRKAPEVINDDASSSSGIAGTADHGDMVDIAVAKKEEWILPPKPDTGIVPAVEWWDEPFLSRENREIRKKVVKPIGNNKSSNSNSYSSSSGSSSGGSNEADASLFVTASLSNSRSHIYVQHPVAVKALSGDKAEVPLPMYLTKKERKRIRKTAREEREREKRDKMMMGLLPAPEPKFKLSNFMKVLGDQAIADPSKVEMRVLQQMRQRELNHEMRNLSAKLTPAERRAKRNAKLQEDTSRQVFIAVFRIKDFSDAKHRFKVDVNAQQHFLSGTVILCQPQAEEGHAFKGVPKGMNLVVVEGGPKGIKKFVSLMLKRIPWNTKVESYSQPYRGKDEESNGRNESNIGGENGEGGSDEDDDEENEDDEEGEKGEGGEAQSSGYTLQQMQLHAKMVVEDAEDDEGGEAATNSCQLLWQGMQSKRAFTGFKFQDCRSLAAARKLLEAKGVVHYWDMAFQQSGEPTL